MNCADTGYPWTKLPPYTHPLCSQGYTWPMVVQSNLFSIIQLGEAISSTKETKSRNDV